MTLIKKNILGYKAKSIISRYSVFFILLLLVVFWLYPFAYVFLSSFKDAVDIGGAGLFPTKPLTLEHYKFIFITASQIGRTPFGLAFVNSLLISSIVTVLVVLISGLAGYALAKHDFFGRKFLSTFVIFQMLFPAILFLIPVFLIVKTLGMINTYQGMILPFIASAWGVFLFNQFFKGIPNDIIESVRIDGGGELLIIFRIMFPLSKSIVTIVGMFTFMARWDEYLWYIILNRNNNYMPLTTVLAGYIKSYGEKVGEQMAGAVMLILPIIILFVIFRNSFTQGIVTTGLKG